MTRHLMAVILLCVQLDVTAAQDNTLDKGFINPPASARNWTWWHWMNGNITREGITADLEAMKRIGLGGAQIFNVSDVPEGPVTFMSPQWLDLMKHAASEAGRLGLDLGFHNCAGWTSSGGPWITPEHAMQTVVTREARISGPARFEAALPQPRSEQGYYRDISVLAFPTPQDDASRTNTFKRKAGFDGSDYLQPKPATIPADACVPRDRIVDLTGKLLAGGKLTWAAPKGDWTILRIGHTMINADNHPSPRAGHGLECDKLSREALDAHWAGGIAPILAKAGPLVGKTLNNILIDSYETGNGNWTPRLREEFQRLRGYDLTHFLPALTGRTVDSSEVTERFLWDFRRTLSDLFGENYYGYFSELCHKNGLISAVEPYGGNFEQLQAGDLTDMVMGEFWAGGGESASVKLAAAIAHTHGRAVVGAEAFTAQPANARWLNYPGALKALGDLQWCDGVNRFIFHRYAHQPWLDKFPGMTMAQYGMHFERTLTWWEQARAWMSYCARSQFLLQQGQPVADVLLFGGEAAPGQMQGKGELKAQGYDSDAFGTDLIQSLTVKDGCITLPCGTRYRLLVLPETMWMTPALAHKMRELVKAGATVMARKPSASPSLQDFPKCDAEVKQIADEVWGGETPDATGEHAFGDGRVLWNRPMARTLEVLGVKPDFQAAKDTRLRFIHRRTADTDIYFISNQKPAAQSVECWFRVSGLQPELWHADTGVIEPAAMWQVKDGRTAVTLDLDPAGSVFVVFRRPAAPLPDPIVAVERAAEKTAAQPLPQIEIRQAFYGVLSFEGTTLADVSHTFSGQVKDGHLHAQIANLGVDPAFGSAKEVRVAYEVDGKEQMMVAGEGGPITIPEGTVGAVSFKFLRAVYGKFDPRQKGVPKKYTLDVTAKLTALLKDGTLTLIPNKVFADDTPEVFVPRQLRVTCLVDGMPRTITVRENEELNLPRDMIWESPAPAPRLAVKQGATRLLAWDAGNHALKTASGAVKTIEVSALPTPVVLTGPWDLTFQAPVGVPPKTTFAGLFSWPEHPDAAIRYFSGTAIYRKSFDLPAEDRKTADRCLLLDLGRVEVIAEVMLNGKDLGILWKTPFQVDITAAARPGANDLEVRVTNLWPNRLIGDEQFPDDVAWDGARISAWPEWMIKGTPRPVKERVTFTTWKHYQKESSLLPSGLLGPVTVRAGRWLDVK